jgi:hypothetical protein
VRIEAGNVLKSHFARLMAPNGLHGIGIRQHIERLQYSLHPIARHHKPHDPTVAADGDGPQGFRTPNHSRRLSPDIRNGTRIFHGNYTDFETPKSQCTTGKSYPLMTLISANRESKVQSPWSNVEG